MAGNSLTRAGLAKLLMVSDRRINQMVIEGIIPREGKGQYDLVPCIHAYINYLRNDSSTSEKSLVDERKRLVKVQADKKIIELKEAEGELIKVSVAQMIWGKIVLSARARILSIPVKLAPIVYGCKTLPEMKGVIDEHIHDVLKELSNPDLKKLSKLGSIQRRSKTVSSSSKADSKPVGRSRKKTLTRK